MKIRFIMSLLVVILFIMGFWICKLVYPEAFLEVGYSQEAVNGFTDMRYSLYSIIIGICFISLKNKSEINHEVFVYTVGVELSIGDLMDRYFFNITKFTSEDATIIVISLILAYLEAYTKFNSNNFNKYITSRI